MAILVGIDEAGFGPILGPLVVSSTTFSLSERLGDANFWQILKKSVTDVRKHQSGRLLISDSKKAYTKSYGIKHLERTVLTCLESLGKKPQTLTELLAELCPECLDRLSRYPWYEDIAERIIASDCDDRRIASSVFSDDLSQNGIKLLELKSSCLDVAYYNRLVADIKNKAGVLFIATTSLIQNAIDRWPDQNLKIVIDRQGGRMRYRENLLRSFPSMELKIIKENPQISSYELRTDKRCIYLNFMVGADQKNLPVSLASMVCKYLRELLIDSINRYFTALHSNLKPTAGYWKDGLRFIEDLKLHLPDVSIDSTQLIRCR